jgi:hypothetical protein
MVIQLRKYGKVAIVLLALTLSQCGEKSKSQAVNISVSPTSPIVFTASVPITLAGQLTTINAPWFSMTVQIDNESDTPVVIIGLHVEVTGTDVSGNQTTVTADFAPASDDVTLNNVDCVYADYGEFDAKGAVGTNPSKGSLNETYNATTGCANGNVTFYVQNNPPPANTNAIVYSVKVEPEGYFGTRNSPADRFDNFTTVFTQ